MAIKTTLTATHTKTRSEYPDAYLRLQRIEVTPGGRVVGKFAAFANEAARIAANSSFPGDGGPNDDAAVAFFDYNETPGAFTEEVEAALALLKTALYNAVKPRFDGAVDA